MTKFKLGQTVMTCGINSMIEKNEIGVLELQICMHRHQNGDWGGICEEDKKVNNEALKYGDRLVSAYKSHKGVKFWIITEADRSVTTVLLPSEY